MSALAMLLLFGLEGTAAVPVQGEGSCPAPERIEVRLGALLPAAITGGPVARARVDRRGGSVRIALLRADGSLLAERFLDGGQPCEDLAAAAAAVIAAWQAGRAEESVLPLPLPAAPPDPPKTEAKVRAREPEREAAVRAQEPGPERAVPLAFQLAVGGGASLAAAQVTPALLVAGSLRVGSRFGVRAGFVLAWTREVAIETAQLQWWRLPLALAPELRGRLGPMMVEGHLGPAAALTQLAGRGFLANRQYLDFELGATGGVRAAWSREGWSPWLELAGSLWPNPAVGFEEGGGGSARPARVEALLAIGLLR